jgi:hypothetical protein
MIPRTVWALMALAAVVAGVAHGLDAPHGLAWALGVAAAAALGLGVEMARGWFARRG